ncbi:Alkaline phosphatase synthesis sensor protein PhoR [compost metagenome]
MGRSYMITALICFIILLLSLLYWQYRKIRKRSWQLNHIHNKLSHILSEQSNEKMLLFTEDRELKLLLSDINEVLEARQKVAATGIKTELSIRRMLSNISHDLKTPLTVVLGYIETMLLEPEMPDQDKMVLLNKVQTKANEVSAMIQHFFDLAKLESGDHNLPLTRVNMNEVCRQNILTFYDILQTKGFEVDIQIPEEPIFAHANEGALDRILHNLISNAIRYGAEGHFLGITLRKDEQFLYVDVWDKGQGIPEIYQDLVFERLYTLEDSRNKSYQGSGLGLTITKRLIQSMGGEITLNSTPFVRTAFTVQFRVMHY